MLQADDKDLLTASGRLISLLQKEILEKRLKCFFYPYFAPRFKKFVIIVIFTDVIIISYEKLTDVIIISN